MFADNGAEMPALTLAILSLSDFIKTKWYMILLVIFVIVFIFIQLFGCSFLFFSVRPASAPAKASAAALLADDGE